MVLEDRGQVQDAGAVQPCCMSPPPCRGFPGQERGCKTNHSCNMRESTWRLWRSLKTLQLWQAGPRLLQRNRGSLLWVAMLGLSSCRTCIAIPQDQHRNTVGHFSGAGATGRLLSSRTCQSLLADCTFLLEPVGSPVVMRLTHHARTRRDVRVDTACEPHAFWGSAPHCNLSPAPLVLAGMGTNACTWLLLVCCSHTQIDFSVPCRMLKM